jgi:hypothetical protein
VDHEHWGHFCDSRLHRELFQQTPWTTPVTWYFHSSDVTPMDTLKGAYDEVINVKQIQNKIKEVIKTGLLDI